MDFLPDEIKLIIISYVSEGKLMAINNQWLKLVKIYIHDRIVYHLRQINGKINLYNKIRLKKGYKFKKLLNNKYGNPVRFILVGRLNIEIYNMYGKYLESSYATSKNTGVSFNITYGGQIRSKGIVIGDIWCHYWLKGFDYCIMNDYIFIKPCVRVFGGGNDLFKQLKDNNARNILYLNYKYILYYDDEVEIYNDCFNYEYTIKSTNKFIYPHDKGLILDNCIGSCYKLEKNYVKQFVVNDHMYLIDENDMLYYFDINTYQLELICANNYYIQEINDKYMIVVQNRNLYIIHL
jgi:hypothetical protein